MSDANGYKHHEQMRLCQYATGQSLANRHISGRITRDERSAATRRSQRLIDRVAVPSNPFRQTAALTAGRPGVRCDPASTDRSKGEHRRLLAAVAAWDQELAWRTNVSNPCANLATLEKPMKIRNLAIAVGMLSGAAVAFAAADARPRYHHHYHHPVHHHHWHHR